MASKVIFGKNSMISGLRRALTPGPKSDYIFRQADNVTNQHISRRQQPPINRLADVLRSFSLPPPQEKLVDVTTPRLQALMGIKIKFAPIDGYDISDEEEEQDVTQNQALDQPAEEGGETAATVSDKREENGKINTYQSKSTTNRLNHLMDLMKNQFEDDSSNKEGERFEAKVAEAKYILKKSGNIESLAASAAVKDPVTSLLHTNQLKSLGTLGTNNTKNADSKPNIKQAEVTQKAPKTINSCAKLDKYMTKDKLQFPIKRTAIRKDVKTATDKTPQPKNKKLKEISQADFLRSIMFKPEDDSEDCAIKQTKPKRELRATDNVRQRDEPSIPATSELLQKYYKLQQTTADSHNIKNNKNEKDLQNLNTGRAEPEPLPPKPATMRNGMTAEPQPRKAPLSALQLLCQAD